MKKLSDGLIQTYLMDCREHLFVIEEDLHKLELGASKSDSMLLDRVFRAVHSIWGGAALFDLHAVRKLASRIEQVLAVLRARHSAECTAEQARILLFATERLSELMQHVETCDQADITEALDALDCASRCCAEPERLAVPGLSIVNRHLPRILLVEDDFACRLLLQTFLSRYGNCHVAVNGIEAVEAFRVAMEQGEPYDLICMDIMMPEMDGREAVRQVRVMEEAQGILSTSGVKIIMVTTVDDVKEIFRCFHELCDAYLMKPIDLTELLKQIKQLQLIRQ